MTALWRETVAQEFKGRAVFRKITNGHCSTFLFFFQSWRLVTHCQSHVSLKGFRKAILTEVEWLWWLEAFKITCFAASYEFFCFMLHLNLPYPFCLLSLTHMLRISLYFLCCSMRISSHDCIRWWQDAALFVCIYFRWLLHGCCLFHNTCNKQLSAFLTCKKSISCKKEA